LLGDKDVKFCDSYVGLEQEYFLIRKEDYEKRADLKMTGRTLCGAPAAKGQELSDHYFGAIPTSVGEFMKDVNKELWKLGIFAKTEHNEVAPGQFELAPDYASCNMAVDQNQLTMDILKREAEKHDLACLLAEKPFDGINGSGKHNNWSIMTDDGQNLFAPGDKPSENIRFLVFLCAFIKAVDDNALLLRMSASSPGNDHRLGANEAPPAVVSIFLGDELTEVLKAIENDEYFAGSRAVQMDIGAKVLPHFVKDNTDRNRTSPFAFTGNKFEFRMLGSEASVANPNIILNTAVAEVLREFSEELKDVPEDKMEDSIHELIKKTIKAHKRVIFNGNGYTDEWIAEAEKRGLYNLKTTPDALPHFLDDKNVELFTKHQIFTKEELSSRYEIWLETYSKIINIESNTMVEMVQKDFLPSVFEYVDKLANTAISKKAVVSDISTETEGRLIKELTELSGEIEKGIDSLKADTAKAKAVDDVLGCAKAYQTDVLSDMETLRKAVDTAESLIPDALLPYPTYDKLLFSV
ncbi:MAG: glutamine synthetase type III, partial [Clostridia bacterium]|nr:glutamine synthetase type III [Clostridia bacterium]MDY5554226.1 glutamine synthetase type III [Blautia sp.]